ncbi:hypothetical protein ACH5RR_026789 [Cinchona calisaya]|uniref:Uncharacterized protein n=1 Tax=Cinchona calisaya TaxID=153742 RepID=A0ABD2Z6S0_9GENT
MVRIDLNNPCSAMELTHIGMYTKTGCLYALRFSTILDPAWRMPSNRSLCPLDKPLRFARMKSGSSSLLKSIHACTVFVVESGNLLGQLEGRSFHGNQAAQNLQG